MARRRMSPAAFGGLFALALCGCPSKPPPAVPPAPPNPSTSTAEPSPPAVSRTELLRWANATLGYLEGEQYAQAEAELQKILVQRPGNHFATRNLAICRQLLLDGLDSVRDADQFLRARRPAERAVNDLLRIEPNSPVPYVLRSRVAKKIGDRAGVEAALKDAMRLDTTDAAAAFDLFFALAHENTDPRIWDTPEAREPILAAGRKAYALQPDNWFFLNLWIRALTVAKEAGELKTVLEQLRPQVEPFAPIIERDTRTNPLKLLDAALASLSQNPPVIPTGPLFGFCNVFLVPEASFDKRRIDKHSLEYVLTEFDDPAGNSVGAVSTQPSSAIPVQFATTDSRVPELPGEAARDLTWIDVDVDGRSDLVVLTGQQLVTLVRDDDASPWRIGVAVDVGSGYQRVFAADLDDDDAPKPPSNDPAVPPANIDRFLADPDFVLFGTDGILVIENQLAADGTRHLIPHRDGVPWSDLRDVQAATLVDLDHDGDLDLFTASREGVRLWSQRGSFRFIDITNRSLPPPQDVQVTAVAITDWDRDADVDVLLSTTAGLRLLVNLRHGRFRDQALDGELGRLPPAQSLRVSDLDGDGAWDVILADTSGVRVGWMQRSLSGTGMPTLRTLTSLAENPSDNVTVWDYDNDGLRDLIVESPSQIRGFRQTIAGEFAAADLLPPNSVGPALPADVDADGDLDLWVGETPLVLRNDGGNANHWIDLRVRALQFKGGTLSDSRRVNHLGVGSLVELRSGDRYQATLIEEQPTHFGLGAASEADLLRIVWTNGIPQNLVAPKVDTWLFEEQLPVGSCPYLYTWDGERFTFCTDLLWNAPLGLKFAEDVVAPWREWEYLKIDGGAMQPRDGQYVLQMTEELWEIAYFDQVKLFAVDHPQEVDVFTNEKVGTAELATPMLHTVRTPRRPIAARDSQGRDVLDLVSAADGDYARTYDHKLASGLVSDHFLELDLGDLRDARRITLFLTGWLYPTDTSTRMQLSQHPTLPLPRPPALWTPDADGQWREVRPFMGFIGGKPKTIAVDVTDAFSSGDYRLRIATNMEFYWDDVFFTVDEAPVDFASPGEPGASATGVLARDEKTPVADAPDSPGTRVIELSLTSADLHHRGFSQAVHRSGFGPEWYDYERVSHEPRWPPLGGYYTRYGDVRPLLLQRDDQLAVFGAGDEMTLTFAVPVEPVPDGWVRDFVLYNVGWDKDAVLNTVYGDAVEPLPFEAMTSYGLTRPLDAVYDRYLRRYQTRRESPAQFWSFIRETPEPLSVLPRSRFESRTARLR